MELGDVLMDRLSWRGERAPWGWRGGESSTSARAAVSRLDRALRRLEELAHRTVEAAPVSEHAETAGLRVTLNPPAPTDGVAEAELRLGAALPADYVRFLLCADGAALVEETGTSAELLGTAALVRHAEEMEFAYRAGCIPELVIFATVGTEGDRLAFETGRMNPFQGCGVLDARRDCRPDQWWVIARDFTSWLEAVLGNPPATTSFGRLWEDSLRGVQPELPFQDTEIILPE